MKVAVITDSAISQGLAAGRHSVDSVDVPSKTAIELESYFVAICESSSGVRALFSSTGHDENDTGRNNHQGYAQVYGRKIWVRYFNCRHYGFPRPQGYASPGVYRLVKHDFHRNSLHDLNVIAGRVLWRKQTETRAASSLNAIDMRTKFLSVQRIHGDFNFVARAHPGYLVLLEIRGDPNVLRNQGEKALTDLNIIPRLNCLFSYPTRLRRPNFRISLIQSRNRQIRIRLMRLGRDTFYERGHGISLSPSLADLSFIAGHLFCRGVIGCLIRFRRRAKLI